jgi:hypothetical protein
VTALSLVQFTFKRDIIRDPGKRDQLAARSLFATRALCRQRKLQRETMGDQLH